jgi:hydroxymethylglutaryl-CoA lyase
MLHEMGIATGVDLPGLLACARRLEGLLGHDLPGQTLRAGLCKHLPADGGPREEGIENRK